MTAERKPNVAFEAIMHCRAKHNWALDMYYILYSIGLGVGYELHIIHDWLDNTLYTGLGVGYANSRFP